MLLINAKLHIGKRDKTADCEARSEFDCSCIEEGEGEEGEGGEEGGDEEQ